MVVVAGETLPPAGLEALVTKLEKSLEAELLRTNSAVIIKISDLSAPY